MFKTEAGSPQFRFRESSNPKDPVYLCYSSENLEADLSLENDAESEFLIRKIRTAEPVKTLKTGDVIYSLTSRKAAVVQDLHDGYLFTQNFVRFLPDETIDPTYLVYLLNEDSSIARQLRQDGNEEIRPRVNVKRLSALTLPELPDLKTQKIIGSVYLAQKKLNRLKKEVADLEQKVLISVLKTKGESHAGK